MFEKIYEDDDWIIVKRPKHISTIHKTCRETVSRRLYPELGSTSDFFDKQCSLCNLPYPDFFRLLKKGIK